MDIHTDQLARELASCEDMSIQAATRCVQALSMIMGNHLRLGRGVRLHGLGSFHPKIRKCRVGTNPKTGEKLIIPEHPAVRFKATKRLYGDQVTAIPLPQVTSLYPQLSSLGDAHASD